MTAPTLRIVKSPSGAKTHRMDERYAPLGKALCGATVARAAIDKPLPGGGDCKRCLEAAGGAA